MPYISGKKLSELLDYCVNQGYDLNKTLEFLDTLGTYDKTIVFLFFKIDQNHDKTKSYELLNRYPKNHFKNIIYNKYFRIVLFIVIASIIIVLAKPVFEYNKIKNQHVSVFGTLNRPTFTSVFCGRANTHFDINDYIITDYSTLYQDIGSITLILDRYSDMISVISDSYPAQEVIEQSYLDLRKILYDLKQLRILLTFHNNTHNNISKLTTLRNELLSEESGNDLHWYFGCPIQFATQLAQYITQKPFPQNLSVFYTTDRSSFGIRNNTIYLNRKHSNESFFRGVLTLMHEIGHAFSQHAQSKFYSSFFGTTSHFPFHTSYMEEASAYAMMFHSINHLHHFKELYDHYHVNTLIRYSKKYLSLEVKRLLSTQVIAPNFHSEGMRICLAALDYFKDTSIAYHYLSTTRYEDLIYEISQRDVYSFFSENDQLLSEVEALISQSNAILTVLKKHR